MASNVNAAFAEFLSNHVRLDKDRTEIAKTSKNWLISEIVKFPGDGRFPKLHEDISIDFGSFSRKTKTRPLDDIDVMIILQSQYATHLGLVGPITISNAGNSSQFSDLCTDGTTQLNSIKVINRFKEYLGKIPRYKKADIKRNQEAATLACKRMNGYLISFRVSIRSLNRMVGRIT